MIRKLIYIVSVVIVVLTLPSCKKYLDINTNPNAAEQVDPKLLFSFATTSYIDLRSGGDLFIPMALAGQSIATGGNNPTGWGIPSEEEYNVSSYAYSNVWSALYRSVGANLKQAISLAEAASPANNNAAAQSKVLLAMAVYDVTTIFGDVPFTEAWRADISYPKFDPQQDVLEGVVALLDTALSQFDETSELKISDYDLIYQGDIAKWKRLATSVKLRTLMTMVDKDPSKAAAIGQIITGGTTSLINSHADDAKVAFQNVTGKKNPKYALSEQYNGGQSFFFGSRYVVDFMRSLNDPRLPKFFTKPETADNYYGIQPGTDGDDAHDVRISTTLQAADAPEVMFSYQEELFYEAEIQARGIGVPVNIAAANQLYKYAVEQSCIYYGVDAATAKNFATGLPDLPAVAPEKLIAYHHWVDKMDRGVDAFTQWRRSGAEGNEVPALTLPVGAPAGPLFRRFEYPVTTEISPNPKAPKIVPKFYEKMWFDL
jgi:TPR repeat protein